MVNCKDEIANHNESSKIGFLIINNFNESLIPLFFLRIRNDFY